MTRRIVQAVVFLVVLGLAAGGSPARAQEAGTITGQVVFKETGEAIYGAEVVIEGTAISTTTDRTGRYRLAGVPAGTHNLRIQTEGFAQLAQEVTVAAGETLTFDAAMEIEFAGVVDVDAPYLRGQARALTQQKSAANIVNVVAADQIGSFPDPNIADAGGRIAGISLIRDDGEGEQMTVRGMQPTLNSVTMNGERIPSTGNTDRSIDFIFMSSDILQSIEVAKALTPEMDGDAIGGSINLVTKQAPEEQVLNVDLQSGYNDLLGELNYLGSFTYGQRYNDGRTGLVLSGSYRTEERGNETMGDVVWDELDIDELILRGEMGEDERYSLNAAYDWLFNDGSMFTLRGTWTERDQNKIRRRSRLQNIPDGIGEEGGRIRKEVRNRDRTTGMYSLSAGGTSLLAGDWQIDYQLAYNASYRDEPNTYSWRFQQDDVEYTVPDVNGYDVYIFPVNENDAESSFSYVQELPIFSDDSDIVGRVDVTYALTGKLYGSLKFGAKYRAKTKENDESIIQWEEGDSEVPSWAEVAESEVYHIFGDQYGVLGQFPGVNWGHDAIALYGLVSEVDLEGELNDYSADEDVTSVYGQAEVHTSPKLMLLFGARYEYTSSSYEARNLIDGEELVPVSGDGSYGNVLPSFHATYAINDQSNIRFAATTALSRPNFIDIVPRQDTNTEDEEIDRGNPGLDPSTAMSLDLLYEYYFKGVGVLTAGLFYKDISDPHRVGHRADRYRRDSVGRHAT